MAKNNSGNSGGIGFVGLLQIVFITLKLTDYIDWSWWWVLSPALIWTSLVVLIFTLAAYAALKGNNS